LFGDSKTNPKIHKTPPNYVWKVTAGYLGLVLKPEKFQRSSFLVSLAHEFRCDRVEQTFNVLQFCKRFLTDLPLFLKEFLDSFQRILLGTFLNGFHFVRGHGSRILLRNFAEKAGGLAACGKFARIQTRQRRGSLLVAVVELFPSQSRTSQSFVR
jgi:hypothetical protein